MPHRLAQHNSHHMTIFEGPGQARLCLQCRNQAENFPCPVKVEEDDEQPQENYRLTPHTSPHPRTSPWSAIRYLCERLRDINAGCIMNFISLQSVLLYSLQNKKNIQKIWIFTGLRLLVISTLYWGLMVLTLIVGLMTGYEGDTVITWSMSSTGPGCAEPSVWWSYLIEIVMSGGWGRHHHQCPASLIVQAGIFTQ